MTSFWEILKSSKNLKASDAFAELWGKAISDSWDIITITGTLPLTFEAKGEALTNYRLYGTENGAGVQTVNLWDPNSRTTNQYGTLQYGVELPAGTYTIVNNSTRAVYARNGISSTTAFTWVNLGESATTTFSIGCIAWCTRSESDIVLVSGSTAPPSFIPYGYELPLTVTSGAQSQDIPVYIGDTKLGAEEYVDYQEQKVWKMVDGTLTPTDPPVPLPEITTYKGESTLSSTETVGEVSVTGKIKEI